MSQQKNENKEVFSSIDLVGQCLIDEEKFENFGHAIRLAVKPEHRVLDLGTGSGVLALLAAQAGASSVVALEFDSYIADVARQNIAQNAYDKVVKVVEGDATVFKFSEGERFDVIMMEMLTTGMVDEFQVQAINNLQQQGLISKETILIPRCQETYITGAYFDFRVGDFEMRMVRHLWKHNENRHLLSFFSKPELLSEINFFEPVEEFFAKEVTLRSEKDGKINAIYFSSRTILSPNDFTITLDDTNSVNAPVVIPLEADLEVKKGSLVRLSIKYLFGGGYQNFLVEVL